MSQQPAKFVGHGQCGSGDIMVLVCYVSSRDHVIKGSCDYMGRSPSRLVTILPSLVVIGTTVVKTISKV